LNADSLAVAAAAGVGAAILGFVLRRSLLPFLAVMAGVALAASLVGIGQGRAPPPQQPSPPAAAGQGPAIVHLILDEHIGVEGAPGARLRRELTDFYRSRGFTLFGRAYSQHFHTVNAIPHMLNFGAPPGSQTPEEGMRLAANAWFSALGRRGYRVDVHQSEFLDFCGHPAVRACAGYDSTRLDVLASAPLAATDKAGLIAMRLAMLSEMLAGLVNSYEGARMGGAGLPDLGTSVGGRVSMLNALAAFDRLIGTLRSARPGRAYFAHLLLPHYPYGLAADCGVRPVGSWMVRRSGAPLAAREAAYADQLRCAMRRIDAALAALAASPAGRDAIVLIHGDHGSRITAVEPLAGNAGRIGARDMIAGFSTLLAVRLPGAAPAYREEPVPVAALLAYLARSGFSSLPAPGAGPRRPTVLLDDAAWVPRRAAPLPASWSRAGAR
ncbi:MAG TPA: hypothetical protein VJS15_03560, partial [Allosphingosinicella sp.]|nr:hypothetical protein [Allosphingosinicella sp.]